MFKNGVHSFCDKTHDIYVDFYFCNDVEFIRNETPLYTLRRKIGLKTKKSTSIYMKICDSAVVTMTEKSMSRD